MLLRMTKTEKKLLLIVAEFQLCGTMKIMYVQNADAYLAEKISLKESVQIFRENYASRATNYGLAHFATVAMRSLMNFNKLNFTIR